MRAFLLILFLVGVASSVQVSQNAVCYEELWRNAGDEYSYFVHLALDKKQSYTAEEYMNILKEANYYVHCQSKLISAFPKMDQTLAYCNQCEKKEFCESVRDFIIQENESTFSRLLREGYIYKVVVNDETFYDYTPHKGSFDACSKKD